MLKIRILSKKILPVWIAVVTFGLTELASAFPHVTEKFYSTGIYPAIASVLSRISSIFPFSMDDIFYILLTVYFISLTVLLLLKKLKFKSYSLLVINTLAAVYFLFYWLWGFNYYRSHLNERLNIHEQKASTQNFTFALDSLISLSNNLRPDSFTLDTEKANYLIESSYKDLSEYLNIDYPQGIRRPKPITFSRFFAKAAISGYFGPFFNEIQINSYLLPVEYPWTLAHEKSHQFGITSEAEANFYAWLICNNSNNRQIRYAANLNVLFYFLYEAKKLDNYKDIVSKIDDPVKSDFNMIIKHWEKLRDEHIEKAAAKANDTYLKTNKVEKGINDYEGVVKYVTEFLLMKN